MMKTRETQLKESIHVLPNRCSSALCDQNGQAEDDHEGVDDHIEVVNEAVKVCMDVSLKTNSSEICLSGTRDGHGGHLPANTYVSPSQKVKEMLTISNASKGLVDDNGK